MSTPPSYLMVCRGGGAMTVKVKFIPVQNAGWQLQVNFTRATQAGSTGTLRPGECAWADRPVSATEPNLLYLHSETRWHPQSFEFDARTRRLTDIKFAGDADPARNLFQWATTENQLFYVHAFKPPWAEGVLIVSKVGP
jgi:hypothetical protein